MLLTGFNMKKLIVVCSLIILSSCSSLEDHRREEFYKNSPAGFTEVINSKKMSRLKPVQIIQLLKKNCCDAIMIEPTSITHWSEADIQPLKDMLGDQSFVAPVASTSGTYNCRGPAYMSTVDREAKHLIRAFKEKTYPLAQCSTRDLNIDNKE